VATAPYAGLSVGPGLEYKHQCGIFSVKLNANVLKLSLMLSVVMHRKSLPSLAHSHAQRALNPGTWQMFSLHVVLHMMALFGAEVAVTAPPQTILSFVHVVSDQVIKA